MELKFNENIRSEDSKFVTFKPTVTNNYVNKKKKWKWISSIFS